MKFQVLLAGSEFLNFGEPRACKQCFQDPSLLNYVTIT